MDFFQLFFGQKNLSRLAFEGLEALVDDFQWLVKL